MAWTHTRREWQDHEFEVEGRTIIMDECVPPSTMMLSLYSHVFALLVVIVVEQRNERLTHSCLVITTSKG